MSSKCFNTNSFSATDGTVLLGSSGNCYEAKCQFENTSWKLKIKVEGFNEF
jgi:hypothetical protein